MRRHNLVTGILALGVVAVAAQAQQPDRARVRSPERTFTFMIEGDSGLVRMVASRRGRIGITVALAPDRSRDTIGARVESVLEGGPAARAGIRAGDLIIRWNGTRLAEGQGDEDEWRSRPGQRLINLAQRTEPGDTVRLEVRRDRRTSQYSVVADSADIDRVVAARIPGIIREFGGPGHAPFNEQQMRIFAFNGAMLNDLELKKVTPQLAEGLRLNTTEGLLVLDIDSASTLGLRSGDVIQTIGGRRASTPAQAMRILSTYEPDETVQFEIVRQGQRQTVSGRMPERRATRWRVTPNNFHFEHFRELERELTPLRRELHERLPRMRHDLEEMMNDLHRRVPRSVATE